MKDETIARKTGKGPLITAAELFSKVLDSEAAHTSFGKLILGDENSAPQYCKLLLMNLAFGTGERFNAGKFYLSKEMAMAQMNAKWSPGPMYQPKVDYRYPTAPKFGFGTGKRNPLDIKPPLYEEAITVLLTFKLQDDPILADHSRKPHCPAPKFGTASRVSD